MSLSRIKLIICISMIISVQIVDRNLEIVYREDLPCTHLIYPSHGTHTRVWKEIYRGKPAEVYLWKTIEGTYTKATINPEKIEWPEK